MRKTTSRLSKAKKKKELGWHTQQLPASVPSHRHLQVSLFSLEFLQCNKSCPIKKPCGYLPVFDKKRGYCRCVEIGEIYFTAREVENECRRDL